ncbi:MAG: TolC family protein [Verrucomicrobiota bacterium]|nr:TolC family protein [Verrucomicrobiota bacterium]
MNEASDPFAMSPSSPYATWAPMKGNTMISSKYCQTLVPPTFGEGLLHLSELIDIALQNNPTTKQTWAMARAMAAQYGQSLSNFYPNVQFEGQYTRMRGTFIEEGPPDVFYTTTAGPDVILTYTLFDFGQRSSASVAAREALYNADWIHNQQIQTVIETVMSNYYQYLYQLKVLKANEASFENAQAALDAANQKFALGIVALGDVAQARTQYLQSKINVTSQKQNVENAFAELAANMGVPANVPFKVHPMPDQVEANPILENVDQLVAMAQGQRQDLLAAQADLRSKEALVINAKRSVLPVVNTTLDLGRYWFQQGATEQYHWTMEFAMSFPLFRGYFYKNQWKNAQANVEKSRAQLMQTELSIIQHVTTAHMNVKTSAQNLQDTEEYLSAAELEFNIALTGYKAGTATILDLLNAQSSLADARSKKAGAQRDWFLSLASLSYATGSLCLPKPEESKEQREAM